MIHLAKRTTGGKVSMRTAECNQTNHGKYQGLDIVKTARFQQWFDKHGDKHTCKKCLKKALEEGRIK